MSQDKCIYDYDNYVVKIECDRNLLKFKDRACYEKCPAEFIEKYNKC